jgi:hypothetical protein
MVFWNFILMVTILGHALCMDIPSFYLLDIFCVWFFGVIASLVFAFGICPFGLLGYSFSKLLYFGVLDTFFWGYGFFSFVWL